MNDYIERLKKYVASRTEKPLRGVDADLIGEIHSGTEWEAELRLSDITKLLAEQRGEAVGWLYDTYHHETGRDDIYTDTDPTGKPGAENIRRVYTAPPAPGVPEERKIESWMSDKTAYENHGWNACRAAMLVAAPTVAANGVPTEQWISGQLLRIKTERGQCGVHETAAALRAAMLAAPTVAAPDSEGWEEEFQSLNNRNRELAINLCACERREREWRHIANEWSDELCNALQSIRNVRDAIATVAEAEAFVQAGIDRCRALPRPDPAPPAPGVPEGFFLAPEAVVRLMAEIEVENRVSSRDDSYLECPACDESSHAGFVSGAYTQPPVAHNVQCPAEWARAMLAAPTVAAKGVDRG